MPHRTRPSDMALSRNPTAIDELIERVDQGAAMIASAVIAFTCRAADAAVVGSRRGLAARQFAHGTSVVDQMCRNV